MDMDRILKFLLILFYLVAGNFVFAENTDWIYILKNSEGTLIEISEPCSSPDISVIRDPLHGSMVVENNQINYIPENQYTGEDSVQIEIECNGTNESKWLYFRILAFPDNVDDANCIGEPEPVVFSIKEIASTPVEVSPITNPLCGDIDGDGEIEILVMNLVHPYYSNAILIYGFDISSSSLYLKYTIDVPLNPQLTFSPLAIAKVDGNPYASIFYTSSSYGRLYKYDLVNGNYSLSWSVSYTTNGFYAIVSPTITDIMGNGKTQVCILDKIYDTETGALLADGGYMPSSGRSTYGFGFFGHSHSLWSNPASSFESLMVAADIDGDGIKEVIGGDCVYTVDLVNFGGLFGNTFTLKTRADNTNHPEIGDGGVAIADIDNDGQLDVIVSGPLSNNYTTADFGMLYVYNPRTGEIYHTNNINDIPRNARVFGPSRPFVGDVDGDGFPEICLTGSYLLNTYKYNPDQKELDLVWSLPTTDFSASTTLTMFDFAQDGKARLVYRDGESLRIINASTTPPTVEAVFEGIYSPTVNDFPVVADVNGDGAAEIIVTGTSNKDWNTPSGSWIGELRVYASAGKPWAPARKVWNQSAYNVLNVNDDLTIPSEQISPAAVFRGGDGILGTIDDIRPFNNFMQQQTLLNKNGEPLWLLPDYELQEGWLIEENEGGSATIYFCVKNKGNTNDLPPLYVTFYKDGRDNATILAAETYDRIPLLDKPECYELLVPDFKNVTANSFLLSVNDKENEFIIQECDYDNNMLERQEGEFPLAAADTIELCACASKDIQFIGNDIFPENTIIEIIREGMYGNIQLLEEGTLRYTNNPPCPLEKLTDTLVYELTNGNYSSRANIIIRINPLPEVGFEEERVCEQGSVSLFPRTGGIWISDNPEVASVNDTGEVTVLKEGPVTFTFTDQVTGCQATTGNLEIVPLSDGSLIDVRGEEICRGEQATLTASSAIVTDPVFKWYETAESTDLLFTGPVFTTPVLITNKTYYISVSGTNYCEGPPDQNGRKAVTAVVNSIPDPVLESVTGETEITGLNGGVRLSVKNASDYSNPVYIWYLDNEPIPEADGAVYTAVVPGIYRVVVTDDVCTAESNTIVVIVNVIRPEISSSGTNLCEISGPVILEVSNIDEYLNPVYQWYKNGEAIPGMNTFRCIVTEPGHYHVEIILYGTVSEISFSVEVTQELKKPVLSPVNGMVPQWIICLTDYAANAVYSWYKESEKVSSTKDYRALEEGIYRLLVEQNGCMVWSDEVSIGNEYYAENDNIETISCGSVDISISPLENDPILNYIDCHHPVVTLFSNPVLPEAIVFLENNKINYRIGHILDFSGILKDSIRYEVRCDILKSEAWIYIFIEQGEPDAISLDLDPEEVFICIYGEQIELEAAASSSVIPLSDIVWSWDPSLPVMPGDGNRVLFEPREAGKREIKVTATDRATQCTGSGTFNITVQDSSRIMIMPADNICQDGEQEISLTARIVTGDPVGIEWDNREITPVEPDRTSIRHNVFPIDNETIYWAYAIDPVCGNSDTVYQTVYLTHKVYLLLEVENPDVQIGTEVHLTVTPSNHEHTTYRWYDAFTDELLGETSENTFSYVLTRAGSLAFYVLTDNGYCPDAISNQVSVSVGDYFIIPNIITPYNKNGRNDTFLTPKEGKPGYKVEIYNRYQQRVFEGENGWDGTYRGKIADPGTYYYRVFMKDGKILKGTVEVAKF
jgi:gliding motility-associated-like protein